MVEPSRLAHRHQGPSHHILALLVGMVSEERKIRMGSHHMKLLFSGIASGSELEMLKAAGVRDLLADTHDWRNFHTDNASSGALDSGAYRAWKSGKPLDVDSWIKAVDSLGLLHCGWYSNSYNKLDFITMPDVLGDPDATWERWNELRERRLELMDRHYWFDKVIPVWQWGAPREHLDAFIDWAKKRKEAIDEGGFRWAHLVAIGGLVPHFREKNESVLEQVKEIASDHGDFLHILGLNWLKAMNELAPMVASCDTSKWLDGARYGDVIYQDAETGGLVQIHHKFHPDFNALDREERSITSAREMNEVINMGRQKVREKVTYGSTRTYRLNPGRMFVPRDDRQCKLILAGNRWMNTKSELDNEKRREEAKSRLEGKPFRHR